MIIVCKYCGKNFNWSSRQKKYCSDKCKQEGSKITRIFEYDKKCTVCGKSYKTKCKKSIYCSGACNTKACHFRNLKNYNHVCLNCNKDFISNFEKTKFCSLNCAGEYKNRIGINNLYLCKNCKKEFYQKHQRHFFCSNKCKTSYNSKHAIKIEVACSYCGNKILRRPNIVNKRKNYFCSRKCESNFRIIDAKDIRYCETCGKEFVCRKGDGLRFCCYKCQGIWQSKERCGKNSSTYNFDITDEMRIKKCEICGKDIVGTPKEFETKKYCSHSCKLRADKKTLTHPHLVVCNFLKEQNISFIIEQKMQRYSFDCYIDKNNLAIEVMGSFYHADIRLYNNPKGKIQEASLKRDANKKNLANINGIKVLYIWEKDTADNKEVCKKLIFLFIKNNGILDNYHSMNYSVINNKLSLNDEILVPHFENFGK